MKKIILKVEMLLLFMLLLGTGYAQSLQHPVIWGTVDDRSKILEKIANYSWASNMVNELRDRVDEKVTVHQTNPNAILNTIPAFAAHGDYSEAEASPLASGHNRVLSAASCAGLLYYLTEEEKYAQFAADIFAFYMDILAQRTPQTTTICGNDFYDPRTTYNHFAIAYDYIYNFLKDPATSVYQQSSGSYIPFDNTKAQQAITNVVGNALQEYGPSDTHGKTISNHPVLTAPGALFPILCIEDDAERERLFNIFWEIGTKQQNAFKNTILPMFGEQGIWPEALSYSFMPNITMLLNIIDRIKPEMNVLTDNIHILEGNFLLGHLRHPDRRFVRYGDSKREIDRTESLYWFTLNMAERRGLTTLAEQAKVALKQAFEAEGGFNDDFNNSTFDNYSYFNKLHWSIPIPETVDGQVDFNKPTVLVQHAGVALQRNFVEENNESYGLCGIIGGAHYVHSHVTGIAMEIYGAGYVMGPGGGLPKTLAERQDPEHKGYFLRHAGNNTVIVNGTTHGIQPGSWGNNLYVWQNTTVNEAAEPKHLEEPISTNFSFATQFLDDEVNNCDQQRTLSTIRTSETTGYYFDLFRSKSLTANNFHDYIYHNLGDATHIFDSNQVELMLTPTERYQTDIGDFRQSPGWRFFEETEVTAPQNGAIKIRFDLNETNTYMNMFAAAGVEREYTKAVGPATREARGGYINKPSQIVAVRQQGEAWDKPFVHIFEPSLSNNTSVKSVEHLYRDDLIVGAKVHSQIGNKTVTDYIICQEDATKSFSLPEVELYFDGRFAIVRQEQNLEHAQLTLYIGEGSVLSFREHSLEADADNKGLLEVEVEADLSRVLGFRNLANNQVIERGSDLTVEAVVGSDFSEVTLWVNNASAGTLTEAPYTWSGHPLLTNMTESSYLLKLVAKDANNEEEESTISILTPGQWARTADFKPHPVPGIIQFENYDYGGIDVAYWDKSGTDPTKYAYWEGDAVDLNGDRTRISFIQGNEWLEYTIEVAQTGYYDLRVKHQTRRTPEFEALSVSFPDENITLFSNQILSHTGSGNFITDLLGNVLLEKGRHVIRFHMLSYGFDLDHFEFTLTEVVGNERVESDPLEVKVYPNPASEQVTISLEGFNKADVAIFNMSGQLMYRRRMIDNRIQLYRGAEFISGLYLIRVIDENRKMYYRKLIFK